MRNLWMTWVFCIFFLSSIQFSLVYSLPERIINLKFQLTLDKRVPNPPNPPNPPALPILTPEKPLYYKPTPGSKPGTEDYTLTEQGDLEDHSADDYIWVKQVIHRRPGSVVYEILSADQSRSALKSSSNSQITWKERDFMKGLDDELKERNVENIYFANSPKIIRYPGGQPMLQLKYAEFGDLLTFFNNRDKKKFDYLAFWKLLKQILLAVEWMHILDVYHCDLKPDNILISRFGPIITDFEFASHDYKYWQVESGTPYYMAPEQFDSQQIEDWDLRKIDIYAVGITFWSLLLNEDLPWKHARDPAYNNFKLYPKDYLSSPFKGRSDRVKPSFHPDIVEFLLAMVHPEVSKREPIAKLIERIQRIIEAIIDNPESAPDRSGTKKNKPKQRIEKPGKDSKPKQRTDKDNKKAQEEALYAAAIQGSSHGHGSGLGEHKKI